MQYRSQKQRLSLMNKEVIKEAEKGYLGVQGDSIEKGNALNLPQGAYIVNVIEDSAAEKAGLLTGDIITKVNGLEVDTFDALRERVTGYRIGTEVNITLVRMVNGVYQEMEVTVVLGEMPNTDQIDNSSNGQETQPDIQEEMPGNGATPNPYYDEGDDFYSDFYDFFQN